jgi:hypothetical protein
MAVANQTSQMTNNNNVDGGHDGLQATNRGEIAS